MSFCNLPDSVLSVVFCEWSHLKNVAKLDTCMTNTSRRQMFLNLLCNREASWFMEPADIDNFNGKWLRHRMKLWAKSRGLWFSRLRGKVKEILERYSPQDLLRITHLHIELSADNQEKDVASLLNMCWNLTSFDFDFYNSYRADTCTVYRLLMTKL